MPDPIALILLVVVSTVAGAIAGVVGFDSPVMLLLGTGVSGLIGECR